ncbi:MFS transporter [Kitasatospora nipponensis]|uniref:MFS transporter n=1 Tax=Kitasatospora nipponensis TaxID=258049 RepID=A0ABN1WAV0_9ACTN
MAGQHGGQHRSGTVPDRRATVFLVGQTVSATGTQLTKFALPLIAVLGLHATPAQAGMLAAAAWLPGLLAPLYAGLLADRLPRRPLMMTLDALRLVLVTLPALLAAQGGLRLWVLTLLAALVGLCSSAYSTALFALLPSIATPEQLTRANGWLASGESAAEMAGPAVGAVLVRVLAAPLLLLGDAVSYLASLVTLAAVRVRPEPAAASGSAAAAAAAAGSGAGSAGAGAPGYLASIAAGFRVLPGLPAVLLTGVASAVFIAFAGACEALKPVFALRDLGLTPTLFGIAMALGLSGGVAAGLLAPRVAERAGLRRTLVGGLFLSGLAEFFIICGGAPGTWYNAPLVSVGECVAAFGVTSYVVANASLRQLLIPADLRGRVFAVFGFLNGAAYPLGALLGGALASAVGLRTVLALAATGQVLVACVLAALRRRLPVTLAEAAPAAGADPEPVPA